MTTILKDYSPLIKGFIEQKQFNELNDLLSEQSISVRELIIFYKIFERVLSEVSYWQSELPLLHLESIFNSDLKISWLSSYLKRGENNNSKINRKLLEIDSTEFIRFFKYTKAFEFNSFFSSLTELKSDFPILEKCIKEVSIIKRKLALLRKETTQENSLLLNFPLHYILSALSLYYHGYKQQSVNVNNKAGQTRIEYALVQEVNRIIQLFFSFKRQNLQFAVFPTNKELQFNFDRCCEPHHILGKKTPHYYSPELKHLYQLFTNMIDRKSLNGLIDMYCCGYSDFIDTENEPYKLKTNDSYAAFQFNNKKSTPEEFYFSNLSLERSPEELKNERIDSSSEEKHFKYYGIPSLVNHNDKSVDLLKACSLLKHFSVYKGPPERTFIGSQYVTNNSAPNKFLELFGTNESITLFEYQTFIENICKYFSWPIEECKRLVAFFTTDLDTDQTYGEWINNPFIICNARVLWIGNLLKDRRWGNILLNKIKSEPQFRTTINVISKNVELNAIALFEEAGYKSFGINRIQTSDGKVTDIDVMAYKDGNLIICEVKSGSRSDDFTNARYYEIIRLEGCAAEQLVTIEQYVRENWPKIKSDNGIDDSKLIDEIKIHSMIITDYFEGDLEIYKNKYSKVSLLELEVLIKNDKKKLLELYLMHQSFINSDNRDFNLQGNKTMNYNLWDGAKILTTEMLIKKIETKEVWKGIDNVWLLNSFEYTLA